MERLLGGGIVARAGAFASRVSTAVALQSGNLATLSRIAGGIACAFYIVTDAIEVSNTLNAFYDNPSWSSGADAGGALINLAVDANACGVKPRMLRPKPPPPPPSCPHIPGLNSFDGDTMVWIRDGLKQIKDIKEGDEVLAWDPATNAPVLEPVLHTSSRVTDDIYRLTLMDAAGKHAKTLVTGNHPYLLAASDNSLAFSLAAANDNYRDASILRIAPGGEWKIVRNLKPGDHIRTAITGAVANDKFRQSRNFDVLTVVSVDPVRSQR